MNFQETIKEHADKIKDLESHADVANREMGLIKTEIQVIKNDIIWIKNVIEKIDSRTWWILGTIIVGFVIQIALKLY